MRARDRGGGEGTVGVAEHGKRLKSRLEGLAAAKPTFVGSVQRPWWRGATSLPAGR